MKVAVVTAATLFAIATTGHVRPKFTMGLFVTIVLLCMSGCAVLPNVLQPGANQEHSSTAAEGTWLVLDAIDTAQTMQFVQHPVCFHEADGMARKIYGGSNPDPSRVLLTNIALAIAHTYITSWLDDKVAEAEALDPDNLGPWYVTRVAWHVVSIVGTGAAVANNFSRGITPTGTRCPQ